MTKISTIKIKLQGKKELKTINIPKIPTSNLNNKIKKLFHFIINDNTMEKIKIFLNIGAGACPAPSSLFTLANFSPSCFSYIYTKRERHKISVLV